MRRSGWTKRVLEAGALAVLALGLAYEVFGPYAMSAFVQRGLTTWVDIQADDPRLTPGMKLALRPAPPTATAGAYEWKPISPGLDVAELPVLAKGTEVDRIMLTRVDPARYRFVVRNQPTGFKSAAEWRRDLGASFVINGSFYSHRGTPSTPVIADERLLGPSAFNAIGGAFVATPSTASVIDLTGTSWQTAFKGALDALVSNPMLVGPGTGQHPIKPSRWLANRSFVGEDHSGKIVFGTTSGSFFSLDKLADFLRQSPLALDTALNLDGGPVAAQSVQAGDFSRDVQGKSEVEVSPEAKIKLLTWAWGNWGLPNVIAAIKRDDAK